MSQLYIISGCNGAGKTTASFTVLPEILNCKEFVNADSIAAGLSPFNPEGMAVEAGRIMLKRINTLLESNVDFAFETTLSTKSYVSLVKKAQRAGYEVTLLFFWLNSPEMAFQRVAKRVREGGHNIAVDVIERRYYRGIANLFDLYLPVCDNWIVSDNTEIVSKTVAKSSKHFGKKIINRDIWNTILNQGHDRSAS
jgi:predicted ABC-type ATPase